jgi:hypothetical protein
VLFTRASRHCGKTHYQRNGYIRHTSEIAVGRLHSEKLPGTGSHCFRTFRIFAPARRAVSKLVLAKIRMS